MRYIFLLLTAILMTSCTTVTTPSNTSPTSPGASSSNLVQSPTGAVQYDPAVQKSIPSPTYGTGNHELVIYADFQCPACINFNNQIGPFFDSYAESGKLLITYKQFPLATIHKNAYRDALAALCAAEQGKYKDFKQTMYGLEQSKAGATVTDKDRIELARANGLDVTAMQQCLSENRYAAQIDSEIAAAESQGVNGTPTLFLDGTRLDIASVFSNMDTGKAFFDRVLSE